MRLLAEAPTNGRVIGVEPSPVMRAQAGFTDLIAIWEPGGNGEELLVKGHRPGH